MNDKHPLAEYIENWERFNEETDRQLKLLMLEMFAVATVIAAIATILLI